jgi:ADP-heptose:LPS heptosyltransferase
MDKLKPIEHKIKALFFSLFKHFLKRKRKDFTPLDGGKLHKVLFLRPEKIGDMVISFPVFDGLKEHYPHIGISILASPRNDAIIKNDPRFNKIFLYRKNLWRDVKEILAIRREKYDCVIDMICDDSVTALFLSQLAAPGKPRIGVGKMKFREYYDFNYDHRMGNTGHIIENTLKLLTAFGIDSDSISGYASPFLDETSVKKASWFIAQISDGSSDVFKAGFNLSAGSPTRIWAEEKSVALLKRILQADHNCNVIILTVSADRRRAERLCRQFSERVHLVPDGMNLTEASAVISKLDVLISPDTSLVHIARALRVPVVGLYSRFMKNFLLWRPYDQEVGAVVSNNNDNIFDISVNDVFETFIHVTKQMIPVEQ